MRGADGAAAALDHVVRTIQQAADEHQVTFLESDVDKNGGRIILVSGAPQTAGDDEQRLLRTLRVALDATRDLPLHIGASRGRVFTGQVGAEFRRTYTVLGDTAALAARLMRVLSPTSCSPRKPSSTVRATSSTAPRSSRSPSKARPNRCRRMPSRAS